MRRAVLAGYVLTAVTCAAPAAALGPMPSVDRTPAGVGTVLCPTLLDADLPAWQRLRTSGFATVSARLGGRTRTLVGRGGCPSAATAASGASVLATTAGDATGEPARVVAMVRAAGSPEFARARRIATRGAAANAAINDAGTTAVTWLQAHDAGKTRVAVAVDFGAPTEVGSAFRGLEGWLSTGEDLSPVVGIDAAGAVVVAWVQPLSADSTREALWVATRRPGAAFAAARSLGRVDDVDSLALATAPGGATVLLVAGDRGVSVATGTAADGLGPPRVLSRDEARSPDAAVASDGAATVAWIQDAGGPTTSARPAGGDFGAPRLLDTAPADAHGLRLATAPDGRVLASWLRDSGRGGGLVLVPVAALGRLGTTFAAPVALAGSCRVVFAALPAFTANGAPRVVLLDSEGAVPGDLFLPTDVRMRVVDYGHAALTPLPPVRLRLGGPRRQRVRDGRLVVSVRCDPGCDALLSARGLISRRPRIPAGRAVRVVLRRPFDAPALGRQVQVVARACDPSGREVRARRTITVRPRR